MTDLWQGSDGFDPSNEDDWETFVDSLSADQLQTLNGLICERMDFLHSMDTLRKMTEFNLGDHVRFTDKKDQVQTGEIVKFNRKTISIRSTDGKKWNVSPQILVKTADPTLKASTHPTNRPGNMRVSDWVAGCTPLPGSVNSDDGYYVPDTIIWLDGDGMVKHIDVLEPGNEMAAMMKSFEKAIQPSPSDPASPPETLRTDNTDLIHLLAPVFPDTRFIHAEVPEIDEIARHMAESFRKEVPADRTYKELNVAPSVTAAFFDAAALLYKARPWIQIPDEQRLLSLTIDEFGINNSVITVIGQAGMSFGVLLFDNLTDYETYTFIANEGNSDRFDELPSHRALNFNAADELEPNQRKEIMENGWPVADHTAYPELFLPVDGQMARHPNARDLHLFETVCHALIGLFEQPTLMTQSWQSGKHVRLPQSVSTHQGNVETVIQLPALPDGKTLDTLNALDKLALIDRSDFTDADERFHVLMDEIEATYRQSPEFRACKDAGASFSLISDLAFNYLETTVATFLPADLEEVLYELVPRKVMINASGADAIINDGAAFFRFLKREYGMRHADMHLEKLNRTAKNKLRDALNDSGKFGLAKSIFTGDKNPLGQLEDRVNPFSEGPLDPFGFGINEGPLPVKPPKALTAEDKKKRKKQRKASRKARKK